MSFSQAELTFKESSYKFPNIVEGEIVTHDFKFTNTGKEPLIISSFKVQCTCTKVELPSKPINPGESGKIKVTFNSDGKTYYQDRIIDLYTNTKKKTEKLRFKVFVEPK